MEKKQWQRVERIVDEAMQIDDLEMKTIFIEEKCGSDAKLKGEVLKLLHSIESSGSFWDGMMNSSQNLMTAITKDRANLFQQSDEIPPKIGPYLIKKMIGHGGMGNIYLAEHESKDFNTQVALKIIRKEINQLNRIKRFIQERRILSKLNHPNIARLFDGGISEDGRPYFVMEYIEGESINDFCYKNQLSIPEKLRLFIQACKAVQFAHTNFIVHRDLKPDNVIVTEDGSVKVLDFGIAKLLDHDLSENEVIETRSGNRFLSLNFASPEQVNMEAVTAATDVYLLGLLLYEILTNTRAFNLSGKKLNEAEHIIRNRIPKKPSSFLSSKSDRISKDLDAIVLKTLRKDPDARYSSVALLIQDIERYQNKQPVLAKKGSFRYKSSKFLHRNIRSVSFSILSMVTLIVFGIYHYSRITTERETAQLEARKAAAVSDYLIDLFSAANPTNNIKDTLNVYDLLETGKRKINDLEQQPEVKINLLTSLGKAYTNIGDYEEAQGLLLEADSLANVTFPSLSPQTANSAYTTASFFNQQRSFQKAIMFYNKAMSFYKNDPEMYWKNVMFVKSGLSNAYNEIGKQDSAELFIKEAIRIGQFNNAAYDELLTPRLNLAKIFRAQNNYAEAEKIYREVLADSSSFKANNIETLSIVANNLAFLLKNENRHEESEKFYKIALENQNRVFGPDHPTSLMILSNLANSHWQQNELVEAEELLTLKLALTEKKFGADNWQTGSCYKALGLFKFKTQNFEQAEISFTKATQIYINSLGAYHPWTANTALYAAYSIMQNRQEPDLKNVLKNNYNTYEVSAKNNSLTNYDITILKKTISDLENFSVKDMSAEIEKLTQIIQLAEN